MLGKEGIPTIDCDKIVARLRRQKPVKIKLKELFGSADKKKIAETVFSSPARRKELARLLHPLVFAEVKKQLRKFRAGGKRIAVTDVPLLFEAGWQARFGGAIVVFAEKEQCIRRLRAKGIGRKDALRRMRAQLPVAEKIKAAEFVIDNSGNLSGTKAQVHKLAAELSP